MSIWKAALLGVMIPAALVLPAVAQDGPGRGPDLVFEAIDLDGDGAVTLQEMEDARDNRFATADADGDGSLDRLELLAMAEERAEQGVDRMLERADADGDGALSAEELAGMREGRSGPSAERIFGRMDADGDGAVSRAEFDAAVARMQERRGGHGLFSRGGSDRG